MAYKSPRSLPPNKRMIFDFCVRFGYTPILEEIAAVIGCSDKSITHKLNHANFQDREKVALAKEFELTAQEFVDMFFPGYFHSDGNVKLDREYHNPHVQRERAFNIFPRY